MKWNSNLWAVLIVTIACNQQVYDAIYYGIMQQAISSKITRQSLLLRYNTTMILRKLCNGQKSSWEQNNAAPGFYKGEVK
jgi:hypothetical protein